MRILMPIIMGTPSCTSLRTTSHTILYHTPAAHSHLTPSTPSYPLSRICCIPHLTPSCTVSRTCCIPHLTPSCTVSRTCPPRNLNIDLDTSPKMFRDKSGIVCQWHVRPWCQCHGATPWSHMHTHEQLRTDRHHRRDRGGVTELSK